MQRTDPATWPFMSTRSPLDRVRAGSLVLGIVFIVSVIGFRQLGDYDWVEAVWMTVITISSVGFSETTDAPPTVLLFEVAVILVGMSAAAYVFGGFVQMALEGELASALGQRRMTMGIEKLKNHVIICGFGRTGAVLADDLSKRKRTCVIIENDDEKYELARANEYLCVQGDATQDETLLSAGLERAATLVSALPSDADNVFITLTARNLTPNVRIIARAEHATTENKLLQAGADKVVMPAIIGAHRIGQLITRPSSAHLVELVTESEMHLELDEIVLPSESRLVGVTVGKTEAHKTHRLLVVAVKQSAGEMVFNPKAEYVFQPNDVAIVMGTTDDISRFRTEFDLGVPQED